MILALFSALIMLVAAILAIKKIRGRPGYSLAAVGVCSAIWSTGLFFEVSLEAWLFPQSGKPFPVFFKDYLLALIPVALPKTLLPVKVASAFAGFGGLLIPVTSLLFALHFPPAQESRRLRAALLIPGLLIALTSWWGITMHVENGVVVRSQTIVGWIHLGLWVVAAPASVIIMLEKARNFMSPLRGFQALFFPIGFLMALVTGAVSGLLFSSNSSDVTPLLISSIAPVSFVFSILFGMVLARWRFNSNDSFARAISEAEIKKNPLDQIKEFRRNGIHLTLYKKMESQYFNIEDDSEQLELPSAIEASSMKHEGIFFAEDFDNRRESLEYNFIRNNYCIAGGISRMGNAETLFLIHRIENCEVVRAKDVKALAQKVAGV